jgi:cytochrome c oxidase subunit IV
MPEHIVSSKLYWTIWLVLICLTGLTAWIATVDLGPFNTVVALFIASFKATIVALFFMHLKYIHENLAKMVIVSALFWLFILLSLSMADYTTRLWK